MVSATRDNLPRVTLDELTFNLFLYKFFQYAHAFLRYTPLLFGSTDKLDPSQCGLGYQHFLVGFHFKT